MSERQRKHAAREESRARRRSNAAAPFGAPRGSTDERDARQPDIAEEHDSLSLAGDLPGGPERARDEASPKGLSGQD